MQQVADQYFVTTLYLWFDQKQLIVDMYHIRNTYTLEISMRILLTPFIVFYLFTTPLAADPNEDAKYIVSQTVSEEIFAGALKAMTPLIANSLIGQLQQRNITVNDAEALTKIIGEEFLVGFTQGMQKEAIPFYLKNFTPEQLADLTTFYKTETGQALIHKTPELMQFGTDAGQKVGRIATQNVMPRIEQRLKDEGVIISKD
jgi:hypothetical protein